MQRSADKDTESPDSSVSSLLGQTTGIVFFFGSRAVQSADACLKEASDPSNIGKVIFSIPDRFRGGYKVFERVPTRGRTIRLE